MKKLLTAGIFGTILGIVSTGAANASIVSSGFLDEKLTEYALSTSLDLKANQTDLTALNDIVGKETWDDFLNLKLGNFPNYSELFFTDNDPNKGLGIDNLSQSTLINFTITGFPTLAGVTDKFLHGWTNSDRLTRQGLIALNDGWTDSNDGTTYLGIKDLNTKIGDLPSGSLLGLSPGSDQIYKIADGTDTPVYPANVAEMIQQLYGAPQAGHRGIIPVMGRIISDISQSITTRIGTLPDGKTVTDMISETETKIGTVPEGKNLAGMISETDAKIGDLPPDTTVAGMIGNPLFLNNEQTIIPLYELIFWGGKGQLVADSNGTTVMPVPLLGLHDITLKVNKIGDLPTEYATVGAALTAIKGIAEDAKAAALAAIPDPKQEGSSGKFVLTVDIVGDNATYRWEKIDREGETTTTTTTE